MQIENNSGWLPQGQAVLLRAIELEKAQRAAAGGERGLIQVPDQAAMASAQCDTMGICVALGPDAWKDMSPRCKVGDIVLFTKYTGGTIKGKDGYVYRMVPSHSIYATEVD